MITRNLRNHFLTLTGLGLVYVTTGCATTTPLEQKLEELRQNYGALQTRVQRVEERAEGDYNKLRAQVEGLGREPIIERGIIVPKDNPYFETLLNRFLDQYKDPTAKELARRGANAVSLIGRLDKEQVLGEVVYVEGSRLVRRYKDGERTAVLVPRADIPFDLLMEMLNFKLVPPTTK